MRGLAPAPIRVHTGLYSLFCDSTNSQVHRHVAHKKPERQALQRLPKQEMPGLPPTSRPYSPMSPLSPMSGASSPLPGLLSLCIIQNRHHYHVYMHTHKHTHTHTHTLSLSLSRTHTHMQSHTHTHTHTHMQYGCWRPFATVYGSRPRRPPTCRAASTRCGSALRRRTPGYMHTYIYAYIYARIQIYIYAYIYVNIWL